MRVSGQQLKKTLRHAALYQRLRASLVRDLYWQIVGRHWIEARHREVSFYHSLLDGLRPGDLIFDVGANDGTKTDIFLRLGARVVVVEPDDLNQEVIRNKFLRFRWRPRPVIIVGKAASDASATATMLVDGPGSALNTLSKKWVEALKSDKARHHGGHSGLSFSETKTVSTTTLQEMVHQYGVPFFIKIDVEGYEPNVLRGLKQPVPFLSFETNLPEFRPEGLECVELLAALSADGRFNYADGSGQGLALTEWAEPRDFATILERCPNGSIEVFWKTPTGR